MGLKKQIMLIKKFRLHLLREREKTDSLYGHLHPSVEKCEMAEEALQRALSDEGVINVKVWRECMYSPGGVEVRTLILKFTYLDNKVLEISIPDYSEMEIALGPPEDYKAPEGLNIFINLDDPENEAWSDLRTWGASLLPDPFLSD